MTVPGNIDALLLGGQRGYQIERSLRFNSPDSAYLNRTPASAGNRKTYTISMWIKRAKLGASSRLFGAYSSASAYFEAFFTSSDTLQWYYWNGSGYSYNRITSQVFRDPSAWCHLVFVFNSPSATGSQRMRIYFNGQEITTFSSSTDPSQNFDCIWNSTANNVIGDLLYGGSPGSTFDGLMTEVHHIDGQALTPSSFGETDTITGVWKPKRYSGTYGTNGFYLKFAQNSIGVDLTSTATLTAPFGGTAENARTSNTIYLVSNTTTGSAFTFLQEDFGSVQQLSRYFIGGFWFTGGSSTFQLEYSSDGSSWTSAASLSVTSSGQNFSGNINVNARYVRLQAVAFGVNGQASIDSLLIYQDPLGADSSPNKNNWVPNNFSIAAGAGNDSMIDVPTPYADGGNGRGNYCTWNPLNKGSNLTISNGNLDVSSATGHATVLTTIPVTSGMKSYMEFTVTTDSAGGWGVTTNPAAENSYGEISGKWWAYDNGGNFVIINQASSASYSPRVNNGDVLQLAIDYSTGKVHLGINNAWINSTNGTDGNPATGANPTFTLSTTAPIFPIFESAGLYAAANFGQRPFAYTPPTGFLALNTQNLPEPSIKKPSSYMDVKLYTGTSASQTISGLGFSPDLVWVKRRSNSANSHALFDAVRGAGYRLSSNETTAEINNTANFTAFTSDGFSVASNGGETNLSPETYVAWCWDESATPGFDIVTYTGDGTTSANRLIDHSLGVKPDFVITKKRSGGTDYGWSCWHKDLGGNYGIWLNQTSARNGSMWAGYSNFSATKFTPPDLLYGNENGATYVNYLWSEVAGFSKFGSYTGNGSADGPFVFCGFRPRWVILKRTDSLGAWDIHDAARDPDNVVDQLLEAQNSNAEASYSAYSLDFVSNGFKLRGNGASQNASGGTFIFAAFAESPFKYSLAR